MAKSRLGKSPLGGAIGAAIAKPKTKTNERTTFSLPKEVAERARDAAYWERESVGSLVERAILREVERLEEARGATYEPRPR